MSKFAILRVEKIKSFGELKARHRHNTRAAEQGVEHCDPRRPPIALHKRPEPTAEAAWDARAARANLDRSKVRKNGVVALEWLATASPEFFKDKTREQVAEWAWDSLKHIEKEAGGPLNVLSAHLHWDESTPHIQVLTIPLVIKKVRGKTKRTLSAKEQIGGHRDRLKELQDDYHAAVAHHGLDRGLPRKETGEKNKSPNVWRQEQRKAAQRAAADAERQRRAAEQAEQHTAAAERDRSKAAVLLGKAREHAATLTAASAAGRRLTDATHRAIKAVRQSGQDRY